MTNEEAKRQLESAYPYLSNELKLALDIVIDALGDCYIIPKNSTWIIDGVDVQEVLEKQKPKKPIYDSFYYHCPICNGIVYKGRGCANNECRQAIDWSEDND